MIGLFQGSLGNVRRMQALRGMSGHRGKNFEPVQNFQLTGRQMSNSVAIVAPLPPCGPRGAAGAAGTVVTYVEGSIGAPANHHR
ncbi:hypothetical protein E2C01_007620 [Portunus trituberculatus]|uniref:Uncharacterized protein n=1 Tax=Portunus trituberculatus TaxID=210409 RepID=A0A5B7D4L5_PORTR|nr:hypothetical protein [Portunus trituberculatus]